MDKMKEIYTTVAEGCIALQDKVGNYTADRLGAYIEKQDKIKQIISEVPDAGQIKEILSRVELDLTEFYKIYDEKKLCNAVLYAKDLKDRYTVLWIYYDLFGGKKDE